MATCPLPLRIHDQNRPVDTPGLVKSLGTMRKKRTKKQSAKATLAEVVKEMAKPRVAMSAREHRHIVRNGILVVKNDIEQ
jgi:hypothetical protein